MSSMAAEGERHYTRPPVRVTIFTVYFQPVELDLNVITDLRAQWREDYPGFKQLPPRVRRVGILPAADLFSSTWPMPAARMADRSLSRTLGFQSDQFSLTWKFDTDAEPSLYPGYDGLANELTARFSEFAQVVETSSGSTVTVEGCQCFYTNTLDGIGGQQWLSSYLSASGAAGLLEDARHFGFRLQREDEVGGVRRSVSLQMDAGLEHAPEVDIAAIAAPSEDTAGLSTDAAELARKLLDDAHNLENSTFEASFSETMKSKWEAKS